MAEKSKAELQKATAEKLSGAELETSDVDYIEITHTLGSGREVTVSMPPSFEEADPDALVYMEQEKPMSSFKVLIGESQWRRYKALGWKSKDFTAVIAEWQKQVGLGNG